MSLAANFSFEPNEIFISQEFLTASLTHNLEDDLPPVEPDKVLPAEQNTKHSLSLEDQLDDIAEKLDIIQQQVEELIAQSKPADEQKIDEQPEEIKEDKEEKAEEQSKLPEELPQKVYVSSGAKPNYLKILISEVSLPIEQRFIKLYNPNETEVNLTDWYLQRKTETSDVWSSCVSSPKFEGKKISAKSYFLISKTDPSANIFLDDLTITENNSLALKNPNREISDEFLTAAPPTPTPPTGGGGGGSPQVVYPKILISEIQIAPIGQRFIELYNPNSTDVSLTDWYLQRKTATADSWSSLVSSIKFEGKTILANGYFLISRTGASADILLDGLTFTENNSLILKDPNRDISDEINLGAIDENKSFCRELIICSPTPKFQNTIYVEPPKDITPPEVSFTLDGLQNSLNFSVNFTIADPLDTVTPSGVGSYIFHWKEETGEWNEDSLLAVSPGDSEILKRDFTGEDKKTYYFQIKAKDIAGNESDWLPAEPVFTKVELPLPPPLIEIKPIIINEIQIEGQTTKDDWVELYNPNDFDVDISGWSIQRSPESG
ncbi:MAG: lamin tail domain-containing protein, partial [Patescibacteria group bacterium]